MNQNPMTDQELRAWSLSIATLMDQGKTTDLADLIKKAEPIGEYIKKGRPLTEEEKKKMIDAWKW